MRTSCRLPGGGRSSSRGLFVSRRLPVGGGACLMTRGIVADRPLSGSGGGRPQDGKYTGGDRRNFDRLWIRRSLGRLLLQEPIEESGVDLRCTKIGMVQDPTEQRNIRLNPTHKVFIERARQTTDGLFAIRSIADQFGQQRIVIHRHGPAFIHAAVTTDSGTG